MPHVDWIPTAENNLALFSANLLAALNNTNTAAIGTNTITNALTLPGTAGLSTDISSFSAAASVSLNHATRTKTATAATKVARTTLVSALRAIARIIQASPSVTNTQRAAIGLPLRGNLPTRPAAPATAPIISATPGASGQILLRVADTATPTKRKRPYPYRGMDTRYQIGGTQCADFALLTPLANITKAKLHVAMPTTANGALVWLVGQWYNQNGAHGPSSTPATVTVPH